MHGSSYKRQSVIEGNGAGDDRLYQSNEVADSTVAFEGVPEGCRGVDFVMRSPADALAENRTPVFEVGEDLKDGTFRDSHRHGQIADADARVLRHRNEDVGMVAEKCPGVP
jgi:hypothetical protein